MSKFRFIPDRGQPEDFPADTRRAAQRIAAEAFQDIPGILYEVDDQDEAWLFRPAVQPPKSSGLCDLP